MTPFIPQILLQNTKAEYNPKNYEYFQQPLHVEDPKTYIVVTQQISQ